VQAKGRSDPAFDAVAFDRPTNCLGNRKTNPGSCAIFIISLALLVCSAGRPLIAEGGEQGAGDAEAVVIDVPEFGGAQNSSSFRKLSRRTGQLFRR
jgi:hypothetical protein